MANVIVDDRPKMNILGLIMGSILQRNLEDPARANRARRLSGDVVVQAGEMAITVGFGGEAIRIRRGQAEKPRARLQGRLDVLAELTLGRGLIRHVLARRVRLAGNLILLLRVWRLLRIARTAQTETREISR